MGKIYQALQEARKNRDNLQIVTGDRKTAPATSTSAPAAGDQDTKTLLVSGPANPDTKQEKARTLPKFTSTPAYEPTEPFEPLPLELEAEKEMTGLHQNTEALLAHAAKKIIQFIGSQAGEGTSTVARDFARFSASRLGKKVLLLEGDPADPHPSSSRGNPAVFSLEEAIRKGEGIERAFTRAQEPGLTVGRVAREERSLLHFLESESQTNIWKDLKAAFDLIVIDSPPLSASSAGLGFCRQADGVILVLEADRTRGPVAENARDQILKNGGNILGVVLNKRKFYIPRSIYTRL
jgi:protein-tyrosine kinase